MSVSGVACAVWASHGASPSRWPVARAALDSAAASARGAASASSRPSNEPLAAIAVLSDALVPDSGALFVLALAAGREGGRKARRKGRGWITPKECGVLDKKE